ncbi:MAG: helix-turn-helix domain-containing protein [Beutenbergiaceae bacterium]
MSELSRTLFLSRPSIYAQVRRIEEIMGAPLSGAEIRTALHVAVTTDSFRLPLSPDPSALIDAVLRKYAPDTMSRTTRSGGCTGCPSPN